MVGLTSNIGGRRYVTVDRPVGRLTLTLARKLGAVHVCAGDGSIDSLSFLVEHANFIKHLIVTDQTVRDISAVGELQQLRTLSLFPSPDARALIDLARYPHIQDVAFHGPIGLEIRGANRLTDLLIESPTARQVGDISSLPALNSLRLSRLKKLPVLPATVEILDLAMFRWNPDFLEVRDLTCLKRLELTSVRGLTNLQPFSSARRLEEIYVEDCVDLASLNGPQIGERTKVVVVGRNSLPK